MLALVSFENGLSLLEMYIVGGKYGKVLAKNPRRGTNYFTERTYSRRDHRLSNWWDSHRFWKRLGVEGRHGLRSRPEKWANEVNHNLFPPKPFPQSISPCPVSLSSLRERVSDYHHADSSRANFDIRWG